MKKKTVIIALCLCIAGIVILGVSFIISSGKIGFGASNRKIIYNCADNIDSVKIGLSSDDVNIVSGNTESIIVTYFDSKNEPRIVVNDENGILSINEKSHTSFSLFDYDEAMTVTVPKDYSGSIECSLSSGDTEFLNITAGDITVKASSGEISLENVSANAVALESSSGELEAENVTCTSLSFETSSGESDFENITSDSFSVESSSGEIEFENLASDNIVISATSGNINGTINGVASDYKTEAKTSSGSCNIKDNLSGEKNLSVTTTSGDIDISFR